MSIEVQSLAVKYRPRSILGLVGQDQVSKQIKGMVSTGRFPSTMLLSGESGTGKTTTARIIARTVNCNNLDKSTLEPCGTCYPCKLGDNSPDYLEVNIADTRGIDDIRGLIQSSRAMPTVGNNRVIILDEVHQLLSAGANCLLKTFEESPPKTLWILATTNPEKLLGTIVGRCTKLTLSPIAPTQIKKQLYFIAKQEKCDLKSLDGHEDLINTIIDLSNGRMRDAISLLESAIYSMKSSKKIDANTVLKSFLTTGDADLEQAASTLLVAILESDLPSIIKIIRSCGSIRGLITKLRWLIQHLLDNAVGLAKYTPYSAKLFSKQAKAAKLKIQLGDLLQLQYQLIEVEVKLNSISMDESVMLLSQLGHYIELNNSED